MAQKYQNEIAPIFYYGISTKTNEKDLKIPNLQPPDWKSPYWMTLYISKSASSKPGAGDVVLLELHGLVTAVVLRHGVNAE